MSLYERFLQRRRKIPLAALGVFGVVALLFFVHSRYPSPVTVGLLLVGLVAAISAVVYLNSLMCCPRCREQVLPWYGHGIPSPEIPRVCRICELDFTTTETVQRTI